MNNEQECYNSLLLLCQAITGSDQELPKKGDLLKVEVASDDEIRFATPTTQSTPRTSQSALPSLNFSSILSADDMMGSPHFRSNTPRSGRSSSTSARSSGAKRKKIDIRGGVNRGDKRSGSDIALSGFRVLAGAKPVCCLPNQLIAAFNGGDLDTLEALIETTTTDSVILSTRSLPNPAVGRHHILKFFRALLESHPDAYLVATDSRFLDETTLSTHIQFKGTKALPATEEIYALKPALVDNMDLTRFSEAEINILRQQEQILKRGSKPIELELIGSMTVIFDAPVVRSVVASAQALLPSSALLQPLPAPLPSLEQPRENSGTVSPGTTTLDSSSTSGRSSSSSSSSHDSLSSRSQGDGSGSGSGTLSPVARVTGLIFDYELKCFKEAVMPLDDSRA